MRGWPFGPMIPSKPSGWPLICFMYLLRYAAGMGCPRSCCPAHAEMGRGEAKPSETMGLNRARLEGSTGGSAYAYDDAGRFVVLSEFAYGSLFAGQDGAVPESARLRGASIVGLVTELGRFSLARCSASAAAAWRVSGRQMRSAACAFMMA